MRVIWSLVAVLVLLALVCDAKKDFYQVLGVSRSAKESEIKKSYHKLSLKFHPDKNPGDKEAEEKFMEVAEAYEVLSDPERKRVYDQLGADAASGTGDDGRNRQTHFEKPLDLFATFPGGNIEVHYKPPTHEEVQKASDVTIVVDLTLEEIYNGTSVNVTVSRQIVCPHCNGTGADHPVHIHPCSVCLGTKSRYSTAKQGLFTQHMNSTCNVCGGTGKEIRQECHVCNGEKHIREEKEMEFVIKPGMPDGEKITIPGMGDEEPGWTHGDLIIDFRTMEHDVYERREDDLYATINITLFEALLGFSRNFTHLDNHTVVVETEAVSSPQGMHIVEGEGMPKMDTEEFGNMYLVFQISFPTELTEQDKEELRSVLDDKEIERLEKVLIQRAQEELLQNVNKLMGHDMRSGPQQETNVQVDMVDLTLKIPYAGHLSTWQIWAESPGRVGMQVWRPQIPQVDPNADPSVEVESIDTYQLVGQQLIDLSGSGLNTVEVPRDRRLLVAEGDIIGMRIEICEGCLSFFPSGSIRFSAIPVAPTPPLHLQKFPTPMERAYPIRFAVSLSAFLFRGGNCAGEFKSLGGSSPLCDMKYPVSGEDVSDHVASILVGAGHKVFLLDLCDAPEVNPQNALVAECSNTHSFEDKCCTLSAQTASYVHFVSA